MIPDMRPVAAKAAPGRAERAQRARADDQPVTQASAKAESAAVAGDPGNVATAAEASPFSGDFAATLADEVTHRAELMMLAQRRQQDAGELQIDRMRSEFDLHEAKRAEFLREWNAIRDLSMEQMKKDDEILKKWIALI